MYVHQFGFQKGKSTKDAVLGLYANIIKATEKHEKTCEVFLDFAKALDNMNHDILLRKLERYGKRGDLLEWLEHYGKRGDLLEWFKSYLENKKQLS